MKLNSITRKILVTLFWIGIWGVAALQIGKPLLLPSPIQVLTRLCELITIADFWSIAALSLLRITIGIVIGICLGILLAIITHYSSFMRALLAPVETIAKVTPVASFILLVLIWLDRDIVPAVISAIMVLPVVWNNVASGLRNIDRNLLEMAHMYRLRVAIRIKRIFIPSIMPYFLSAVQTSIGIGWKAGIAAEVLTVPARSIGKMIADSKMYMETVDLFTWTVVVIVISLLIEKITIRFIQQLGANYFSKVGSYD